MAGRHREAVQQDVAVELHEWHMWWKRRGGAGVRRVLMEEWDPIGVREWPDAADEYDTYVGRVGRMLRENASAGQIAGYLRDIRTDRMGLEGAAGREDAVAASLITWYRKEMQDHDG
jgi:hypothetical protein